ncbi:MAG: DUF3769 domain-containing protein [Microcoleus vaginatus WJT46-NPBG5]|nr:DUF3769 domain-containing protein [Microcoleus vaginatus WJT46-NPBG5]
MPYPVPPPEPPSVVKYLQPEEVPHSAVSDAIAISPTPTQTAAGGNPSLITQPKPLEPERLQSSPLPALQRLSVASLLKPLSVAIGWSQPASEPQAGTANELFPPPPITAPENLLTLPAQSVFIHVQERAAGKEFNYQLQLSNRVTETEPLAQNPVPVDIGPAVLKKTVQWQNTPTGEPVPLPPIAPEDVVELTADRQEYDSQRQIVTAQGNVVMRVRDSVLDADRIQINLQTRMAAAEGNVAWRRGQQVLRGDRFEYNFIQNVGTVSPAGGELYLATGNEASASTLPTDVSAAALQEGALSDRILAGQPLENVTETPGGVSVNVGSGFGQSGQIRRVRYEADQLDFTPEGGLARNIRLTNDPFSPPELELRAERATFTRVSPLVDEIRAERPRLVFDGGFSLPLLRNRVLIDRRERDPALYSFGYDREDRGGVFVEGRFNPLSQPQLRLSLRPQFYIQRALEGEGSSFADLFGLKARLNATLTPRTSLIGSAVFTSLDLNEVDDNLRASLRLRQLVGTHALTGEYSFRDRLFNGSLGYQTVQSSLGAVLTSPVIQLGTSRINLSYQAAAQYVNADTDRLELLDPIRENNRAGLGRYQASAALSRGIPLWRGQSLPATATEGLKYTPVPVLPYLQLVLGLRGVTGFYSNGDNQSSLTGSVGILGQIGNFSRPWLDYTGFNLTYTQVLQSGESPFYFDRIADVRVLGGGIVQQIYGPFRLGFQTAVNLDTGEEINTDYILEYSRRTYGIVLRYNPVREIGTLTLRISDFNWTGGPQPFAGSDEIRSVEGGVRRDYD